MQVNGSAPDKPVVPLSFSPFPVIVRSEPGERRPLVERKAQSVFCIFLRFLLVFSLKKWKIRTYLEI
jgi:hypothetical protein